MVMDTTTQINPIALGMAKTGHSECIRVKDGAEKCIYYMYVEK